MGRLYRQPIPVSRPSWARAGGGVEVSNRLSAPANTTIKWTGFTLREMLMACAGLLCIGTVAFGIGVTVLWREDA